jgi:hypothetical protein
MADERKTGDFRGACHHLRICEINGLQEAGPQPLDEEGIQQAKDCAEKHNTLSEVSNRTNPDRRQTGNKNEGRKDSSIPGTYYTYGNPKQVLIPQLKICHLPPATPHMSSAVFQATGRCPNNE